MSAEPVQDHLSRGSSAPFTAAFDLKDSILVVKFAEQYLVRAAKLFTHERIIPS